jgi:hypothetical protein
MLDILFYLRKQSVRSEINTFNISDIFSNISDSVFENSNANQSIISDNRNIHPRPSTPSTLTSISSIINNPKTSLDLSRIENCPTDVTNTSNSELYYTAQEAQESQLTSQSIAQNNEISILPNRINRHPSTSTQLDLIDDTDFSRLILSNTLSRISDISDE